MKNSTKQLLVSALVLTTAFSPVTSTYAATGTTAVSSTSVQSITDLLLADAWAQDAIVQAKAWGLMTGDPTGTFRPLDTITRQELAVILTNLMNVQTDDVSVSSYKDVTAEHWGARHIAAVSKAGLMQGDGNGSFRPDDQITREELAVVLARAAKADVQGKGSKLAVGDKTQVSDWAKDYVQAAIELGLMKGDGANFNPTQHAQRQEVAMVAVNFKNAAQKPSVLTAVTDNSVTINGAQYAVAANLQGLLNAKNADALQGANLRFQATNGTVQALSYLELTQSGTAAGAGEAEFSHNRVLDAQNATIDGDVKIAADYVSVQNLNVTGDLEISSALQNDFYGKNLQISGKTIVNGGDNNTVVFADSKLKTVDINKQDVRVEPKGQTQLEQININSNAAIVADSTVPIPQLTVQDGVEHVDLTANIGTVEVKGTQNTVLTGDANIANLKADGSGLLTLSTKGKIDKIDVTNSNGALALGDGVKVEALNLPEGKAAKDVVRDYDNHNDQVSNINGQANPNAGGNAIPDHVVTTAEKVAADKAALTASKLLGENLSLTDVTSNLTLPTKGAKTSDISWASSDVSVVSNTGVVTRPSYLAGDATVTLTATIRKGNVSDKKTFTITVKKLADLNADAVLNAKNALTDAVVLGNNSALNNVVGNLNLPTAGENGTTIEWGTTDNTLVTPDGIVTRPEKDPAPNHVTLTATIRKGTAVETKTFEVTVAYKIVKVQLLALNDLHGKLDQTYALSGKDLDFDGKPDTVAKAGRLDYLSTYLKQRVAQNPNSLIVHTGDATGGSSPVSALENDEPTVEALNAMNFSLGTVGNHEFDRGTTELKRLMNGPARPENPDYKGMNYPLIAANVQYKDSGNLVFKPYEIKEVAGEKIGFIGVVTRGAASMVMQSMIQDIQFTDEATAVNKAAEELKAQGVHSIVVLAHVDLTQDKQESSPAAILAGKIDSDVDVIFAAHNHEIAKGTQSGKLLVQAFEYGKAFADVDLEIDTATHDIVSKNADVVINDQSKVAPDPAITAIIDKYTVKAGPTIKSQVGTSAVAMMGGYTGTGDNQLGNLIADGMRRTMNSDFAMMNGGGIRTNLKEGPILWEDLFNIQPFNNVLTKVTVKGANITKILEAQLSVSFGSDYSIAGMKYTYNYSTQKVTNITTMDGTPIDPNKEYTIVVNNFMATGINKYAPIPESTLASETGPEDLPALMDYVKSFNGPVTAPELGRIKISNEMSVENNAGVNDKVTVTNLTAGDTIKVYSQATAGTLLGTATVQEGQTSVDVPVTSLELNGGNVYVSITAIDRFKKNGPGYVEGVRFPVAYTAEPAPVPGAPTLSLSASTVYESDANDGTVTGTEVLTLTNGTFANDLTKADVTVNNLPAGLTYEVTRDSDTQVTVTLGGKAISHTAANNVTNAYFTIAQAKVTGATENVTSNNFAINFKDPAQPTYTDIAIARGLTANTVTTIHGIITADNSAVGGGKLSTYVQDSTGGVNVFMNSIPSGIDLKEGDEVVITGKMTAYQKLTEIAPALGTDIKVLSHNNELPAVKATTLADLATAATAEPLEGQLVNVSGYLLSKPDTTTGTAWNMTLIDKDFNTVTLRVLASTNTAASLTEGTWYDITGIVGQYADTYQVMPRKTADISESTTQDPAPSTVGVVKPSTVLRGVDGDTIKLATPIYGADNVRFLSIDTPETVYNNMSQGPHGDAAHHSLDMLLPANTPVELHFGSEPLDKYGRLLAHVYKDGKDMNLEQVRLGFATTYQIYPNLDGFEIYADALKEAKQAKRGIWNPADPLLEMPFVFRARLDGNAPLSKPVGDFFTKQYVDPALWYTIPAENRVFFWNETDVTAAGYTKKTYQQSNTTLFSDVYQVDDLNGTVSGFPYEVSLDTVKATVKAVVGATVKFTLSDGTTEISTNTLAQGNKIVVTAADGTTQQTYTVNTDPIPQPTSVSNVTATSADTDVTATGGIKNIIRWNDGQFGMSYEVFRGTTDKFEDAISLGIVPFGRQIFTDETPQAETTYTYFVVAKNTSGSAATVSVVVTSAVDLDQAPEFNAPSNLVTNSNDSQPALVGGVKTVLTWTDATVPNASYNILRGTVNDPGLAENIGTVEAGVQRFEDTTALADTQYYYFVSTVVNGMTLVSDASTVISAHDAHLLISQVYGGGGAGSATAASYKYDFVELFNPSAVDISLNDYSLQYGSSGGTTALSLIKLTGTIPAGGYFLIKLAGSATAGGADLTDADLDTTPGNVTPAPTTLTLAASSGKIALVANQTGVLNHSAATVIDFIGYGTANDSEGGTGTAVGTLSNTTAAVRKFVNGMFQDTDNNKNDFQVLTPVPHNSKTPKP